jgi:hypothetical protein
MGVGYKNYFTFTIINDEFNVGREECGIDWDTDTTKT